MTSSLVLLSLWRDLSMGQISSRGILLALLSTRSSVGNQSVQNVGASSKEAHTSTLARSSLSNAPRGLRL